MEDSGPSVTARRVAAHRLGFARVATDYGDPAADEAIAADVAAGRAAPANRMHDYLAARTSFFDQTVVSALEPLATGQPPGPARGARAIPGQLARLGPPPGYSAAFPDGAAPRRLSRRQLTCLRTREL